MQLRLARVCLDCEEVHDAQQCPVCASETFAFLTRWVPAFHPNAGAALGTPVDERRSRPASRQRAAPEPSSSSGAERWVKRGVAGLALLAAGQWLWSATRPAKPGDDAQDRKSRPAAADQGTTS